MSRNSPLPVGDIPGWIIIGAGIPKPIPIH
jgi:hypothetical protein